MERVSRLFDVVDVFLDEMRYGSCGPSTVENYRYLLYQFVGFLQERGCHDLRDVSAQHLREWMAHKREQGVSRAHLYNCYRIPKRWWNWCLAEELIEHDPFSKVPKPKNQATIKYALTDEQIRALLDVCTGKSWLRMRDRALVLVLLGTGLRAMEAQQMRVSDIRGSSVLVRNGKGGKQRMVPLPPQAKLAVLKYLSVCPYKPQEQDPLWYGIYGPLTLDGIKQVVRDIGNRAGLKIGPHLFRHTFGTRMLAAGASMEHVRLLMGHSDYTVLKQYLHLVERDLQEAMQKFNPLAKFR